MTFNISDWVHGRTMGGEMVYGFIESVDALKGIVTLFVVQSDNEERIGRHVAVKASTVKSVPDVSLRDNQPVQDLIDLALATWDEAWFKELTDGLGADERDVAKTTGSAVLKTAPVNRLSRLFG
ncbi:group-specific protein [Paenibacillus sp. LHD-117]|uniref:group-specific protein n=1 Tax=Paenibacillus sp. LHD-117 TaxID=3071412 RepID=UPI0027E1D484|nr:group-specific protein [Paenibacillus sp. LHD-117]MDQ6420414.1 group-specific protein [Paenibacillus sp. LHD-117]